MSGPGIVLAFDPQIQLYTPIVQGFFQGAVYGLIGLGIVLLYKSNGIFNFAQAEFGTVAALVTYGCLNGSFGGQHMPYAVAALLGVVAGTLSAVLTERLVVRPLFNRPKVILLVGTVGVLLLMVAIEGLAFQNLRNLPAFNAKSKGTFADPAFDVGFAAYRVSWQEVLILVVLLILALGSVAFFRYSQTGTAILAVSQEPTAAAVVGISVSRISLITWTIAGFLGSVGGLLLSPGGGLIGPGTVTATALIAGFTAAVLGGITSLPGAFVGGVLIGILQRLAGATITQFPGSEQVTVGLVLLVVLLIRPQGLLGKEA
ncbi:MAG: branched-chain amino acid transport system permease protein [Actinomycetota bacterium]|nr:branched-chain amino acid transport system permease protein [Actinomycetota bacterium]